MRLAAAARWIATMMIVGATAVTACSDEVPACYEGEYVACTCGEDAGYQRCQAERYQACVCDGTTPGLQGTAEGGGGEGGAGGQGGEPLLGFLEPCDEDEQCETGLCHLFNAKGPRCTHPCGGDDDCAAPSPGCNMMGICKAP